MLIIHWQFDKFINTVNRNLVDSNMFIRSLVLSLEHLMNEEVVFMGKTTVTYSGIKCHQHFIDNNINPFYVMNLLL